MCSSSSSSRRARRRTRKPKFLSLRRHLAQPPMAASTTAYATAAAAADHIHERDPQVACLLEPDDGGATLAALLGPSSSASSSAASAEPPPSPSVNWDGLARRALRGRERMVFCRWASAASSEEEVASGGGGGWVDLWCGVPQSPLSLKLDYEEVLSAWSDRGSLYMKGEGTQVVPQIHHTFGAEDDCAAAPSVFVEVGGKGMNVGGWTVPETTAVVAKEEEEGEVGLTENIKDNVNNREARVMRYKEKRRSRLFAKRIRYEVRKLNAEKRPRIKGRFVKRKDDM